MTKKNASKGVRKRGSKMTTYKILKESQQELDNIINDTNGIDGNDFMAERVLALLVEIGEFANETRCFKFWSQKNPSSKAVVLLEFVDVLHFMLSVGNYSGFAFESFDDMDINRYIESDINDLFIDFYFTVTTFRFEPTPKNYANMYSYYFSLAKSFGFSDAEVIDAYFQKNEINVNRQANGY